MFTFIIGPNPDEKMINEAIRKLIEIVADLRPLNPHRRDSDHAAAGEGGQLEQDAVRH